MPLLSVVLHWATFFSATSSGAISGSIAGVSTRASAGLEARSVDPATKNKPPTPIPANMSRRDSTSALSYQQFPLHDRPLCLPSAILAMVHQALGSRSSLCDQIRTSILNAQHGRARRVLDLDPALRPSRAVGRIARLNHWPERRPQA